MAKINPSVFKAYDIRGIYPSEINEEAAYLISKSLVKFLNAKSIVAARDMRPSSAPLYEAVLKGLKEMGVKIFGVGLSSTPMHTFVMNFENADAGIMITASHNPAKYNGLKLERKLGTSIGEGSGMEEIKEMVLSGKLDGENGAVGNPEIIRKDYLKEYVKFLYGKFSSEDFSDLQVAVDAGNGMTGFILPHILKKLKIKYYPLYFELDGPFPNHEANPAKSENLKDLSALVIEKKFSLGVAFDGDGDRVAFVDGRGQPISIDFILAMLSKEFLKEKPGIKVVHSVSSSRIIKETVEENGGQAVICRVGHAFFRRKVREEKAYFGCEISGHCFFEDFFYADSAIFTMLHVLRLISRTGKKIEDLIRPFKKYFHSGEINLEMKDKLAAINLLESAYGSGFQSRIDGLTVEYPDWWFNIRPSNTEPLLRLTIEANTQELLQKKKKEILEKIVK
ncbi:MAG: phosphomannomutase/phosphoglucomutase [Candidatus Tagabacteria bacterium CG11_big_fil_rev_8_21_14_0_20_41_11]|nr:MAG: phosphomannomutase/phosphoglucomutase [Candidatus Tagabacteria bacterium CG11_big_fil_rev_8_21_14_0_20_41_11]